MDNLFGILLSLFFGFVPMFLFAWFIYWLDRYEKEPKMLLGGVFFWGAVVAAGGAFLINTILGMGVYLFTGSEYVSGLSTGSLIAPVVEESLKGFAIFIVFLAFRSEFDSILDGIVYAAITALGFAATENAYYIYTYGYADSGLSGLFYMVFMRVFLVGWQHPFYTAFIGIGLAMARLNRSALVKLFAPVFGLLLAMFTHSVHNTLVTVLSGETGLLAIGLDWTGWFMMFLFIIWALYREQLYIQEHLREEVALGVISLAQYRTACSAWAQVAARTGGVFSGGYRSTSRFYQLTAELAHKKHQRATLGEEGGNTQIIEQLRAEIAGLARVAQVF